MRTVEVSSRASADLVDYRDLRMGEPGDEPGEPDRGHQGAGPVRRLVVPDREPAVQVRQPDREVEETRARRLAGLEGEPFAHRCPGRAEDPDRQTEAAAAHGGTLTQGIASGAGLTLTGLRVEPEDAAAQGRQGWSVRDNPVGGRRALRRWAHEHHPHRRRRRRLPRPGARVLTADGFEVVGEAADGCRVSRPPEPLRPDLVLLDIGLPDVEGFEVAHELAIDGPPPFVVLTSSREAGAYGPRLAASRVLGFIPKDELSGAAIRALIPAMTLRIALADDSVLLREGIARLSTRRASTWSPRPATPTSSCGRPRAPPGRRDRRHPDAADPHRRRPPRGGGDPRGARHRVGILVLSQYVETTFALRLVADGAGGMGYLLKDRVDDLDDFADAIRRIARGGSVIDPEVVAQLVGRRRAASRSTT